ncbi:hypothetical protein [Pseudoxanthomonas sp. Root630]|uniref:hypothetical protein n=1 Tax=Pseudoxanthomonas sp. Root630 TaxID=1736574 RepID=UPI0007028150|nr:hypothetical protein [Pseudoxanthomonas sp. Root630]KRA45152.1 hypothetical protein ASD72_07770 [Pseudoxanthomonas sp. Root630]
MDFLKILKSFEEFVYEALTWVILLPRTLLRTLLHPDRMTAYAAHELARTDDARFSDAISPPLLLILCVLLAHLFDLGVRAQVPDTSGSLAAVILASEETLLLYRTITFGVWALAGATYVLMRARQPVNRESLRQPFYEQCYLVAPFALVLSCAMSLLLMPAPWTNVASACLTLAVLAWFWVVQAAWIRRRTRLPWWRCLGAAAIVLMVGGTINATVGYLLAHTAAGALASA